MADEAKSRRRMVVEEIDSKPEVLEEIKDKVEELKDITENISESVEKSEDVQEEISQVVDEVTPAENKDKKDEDIPKTYENKNSPDEVDIDSTSYDSHVTPQIIRGQSGNPLYIIIPGIFILGALLGGIYFYQKGFVGQPVNTPEPTADLQVTPEPAVTSTPSAQPDLSKYPINVMNGSGIGGEAGRVKTILTDSGFKVSSAGNASSYDFTKTIIKVKSDVPKEVVQKLSDTLSRSYVLDSNQTLAATSADSIQVIIGSSKAK